jgi:hypothetical protein
VTNCPVSILLVHSPLTRPKQASKHYARILTQWPVDRLRPELAFQTILKKRIDAAPVAKAIQPNAAQVQPPKPRHELNEINALYSLVENRYSSAVCRSSCTCCQIKTLWLTCAVPSTKRHDASRLRTRSLLEARQGARRAARPLILAENCKPLQGHDPSIIVTMSWVTHEI